MKPIVIGVAGGTGSGKTTVVRQVVHHLGEDQITVIQHDSYYRDRSSVPVAARSTINYDHPDALQTDLLVSHIRDLRNERVVQLPVYDFSTHTRLTTTRPAFPKKVIIVEGILIFVDPELRRLIDMKIFVDTDADTRLIRRLKRDLAERGRSLESVFDQYETTVKPMHLEFVEPSKRYADVIIPEGGYNAVPIDMLITKIRSVLDEKDVEALPAL